MKALKFSWHFNFDCDREYSNCISDEISWSNRNRISKRRNQDNSQTKCQQRDDRIENCYRWSALHPIFIAAQHKIKYSCNRSSRNDSYSSCSSGTLHLQQCAFKIHCHCCSSMWWFIWEWFYRMLIVAKRNKHKTFCINTHTHTHTNTRENINVSRRWWWRFASITSSSSPCAPSDALRDKPFLAVTYFCRVSSHFDDNIISVCERASRRIEYVCVRFSNQSANQRKQITFNLNLFA